MQGKEATPHHGRAGRAVALRPKYPPTLAIHRIACPKAGGCGDGVVVPCVRQYSACRSKRCRALHKKYPHPIGTAKSCRGSAS
ncbi:MAG: hypothetical protein JWQ23_4190 [Herminiimonas sp.]|nr:hypothetical protein [Herminiimonas sp.]